MAKIFREEVIERQTNRLHGDILVLPRLSHTLILLFLLCWVFMALCLLLFGRYARKETVNGWIEPSEGVTRVYSNDTGLITQILVSQGQVVMTGEPLLIVNGDQHLTDGSALESRLLSEYEIQRNLLTDQLENSKRLYQRKEDEITNSIKSTEEDLELLNQQLQMMTERHDLLLEFVKRNETLRMRQLVSQIELENTRLQEISLRNEKHGLLREKNQLENSIEQLRINLQTLPDQQDNEEMQLRERLSNLAQQITQLHGRRFHVVNAPISGKINIQANVGDRVGVGSRTPLFTITPESAEFRAELLVPVRSIGFVRPGQSLDIRYDAFPYQRFGLHRGEVLSISDTVILTDELTDKPLRIEEPVYRVTASLEDPSIQAYGQNFTLKPDMTLSADIRLSERSLLQWVFEPIYSLRGRL